MTFQPTDQQIQALPLLASGESHSKVAQAVGTSPSTICRWLKNPDFKKHLESIQQEKLKITKSVLAESATTKAENLQATLQASWEHQDEIIKSTREITTKCLNLLSEVVDQVDQLVRAEDRKDVGLSQKEKTLLIFMPNLMRNAAILITSVNETWDRRFGLEELSKRLDEWGTHWFEEDRN